MWPEVLITVLCVFSFSNTSFSCRFYQISSWNFIWDNHYKKVRKFFIWSWHTLERTDTQSFKVDIGEFILPTYFFWLHLMADLLAYSHFSLCHVFTKSVYSDAFLQKLPMLSQVKHQHWTDEMAWCDTITCIACAPLLLIVFQDLPNYLLAEFCKKFLGNFRYIHSAWCECWKDVAFWKENRMCS